MRVSATMALLVSTTLSYATGCASSSDNAASEEHGNETALNSSEVVTDPFSTDLTGKEVLKYNEAFKWLPPGALRAKVGTFKVYRRKRACGPSGCTSWQASSDTTFRTHWVGPEATNPHQDGPRSYAFSGDVYLVADDASGNSARFEFEGVPVAGGLALSTSIRAFVYGEDSGEPECANRGLGLASGGLGLNSAAWTIVQSGLGGFDEAVYFEPLLGNSSDYSGYATRNEIAGLVSVIDRGNNTDQIAIVATMQPFAN